jgi:3-dehydroquinate dehydratase/shikimate dehydrogenase
MAAGLTLELNMTAIGVPIFVKNGANLEELIDDAEDALDGLSQREAMIELRCDQSTPRLMLEAIEFAHYPVLITVRPTWEGGHCDKDDEYRIGLWEAAMEAGVEYVDVELAAWERNKDLRERVCEAAEKSGTKIVLTNHFFEGRPKDLEARVTRLRRVKQADVLKIAWKAESIFDAIEALKLTARLRAEDGRAAVALAMGEEGVLSRVLSKKFDAAFMFAALERGAESAPGQVTVAELRDLYRWDDMEKDTPVYAVAGWPVAQSKSPAIHNAGFDAVNVPGTYVPLAIRPGLLGGFGAVVDALRAVPGMNLRGISVTIPHKEAAFKYVVDKAGKIDDLSWRIGVLNTLVWEPSSDPRSEPRPSGSDSLSLRGFNSDYDGALDALASAYGGEGGGREALASKRVAVLGAGGAARAIVAGLASVGATAIIYNRTREKADALAADFTDAKVIAAPWESLPAATCDAYINCTPLGMFPDTQTSPIEFDPNWTPDTVVFDTVYNPELTRLLKLAESKGAKIVKGTEMFVRQAAAQFKAFTGKEAPVEEFWKAMTRVE